MRLFGQQGFYEIPTIVRKDSRIDRNQLALSLRAVLQAVVDVSFRDGKLEVVISDILKIGQDQNLTHISLHFGLEKDLQIVSVK